ncbi:MAG TPA: GntR family transcriptional regulator [Acidimicrobiales bacterium]|nr:GntR family transcriptional regulator [Acidimicrobiales bacterium]
MALPGERPASYDIGKGEEAGSERQAVVGAMVGTPAIGPASRRVLADEVADAIRDAIFAGRIDLGQRLVEEDLASNLNVSRGPVREALVKLSQEGLVHMERHRGATVAQLGLDEVSEIYSLRTALERLAAEWLCRNATDADFNRMTDVLKDFDKLPRPLTRSAVASLDVAFHDAVYQAAHHERLYQAWLALRSQIFLYLVHRGALRADFASSWLQDHEDFLEILRRRKRASAVKIVEGHIEGTYQRVLVANAEASAVPDGAPRARRLPTIN